MSMNRRNFLRLLAAGIVGHELDIDRMLWVPGAKKILLPSKLGLSTAQIISSEMERIIPTIHTLFEKDDMFYQTIGRRSVISPERSIRVPLIIRPGENA